MLFPIKSVRIRNFRGIRDLAIDLDPQVTVLFGSNAAGKTSVLDAIAIGLGAYTNRVPRARGRDFAKSGDLRRPWKSRAAVGEMIGVEKPFAIVEMTAATQWSATQRRAVQDSEILPRVPGKDALHALMDPWIRAVLEEPGGVVPASVAANAQTLPLVAAYGTERAVVEIPLRERDFAREFARFEALSDSLSATTRFKSVFEWFRLEEDEERRERGRRANLKYKLPALEWVRRAVERAELRCRNPRVETKPIRMLVDFMHENGHPEVLDITSLSDGYRTHFALVVDIARRMVQLNPSDDLSDLRRGTNTEAVILVDEIDLHLDPVWQGRVVAGLRAAFPNTQFVLTTHSEQVLGSVEARSVRKLLWNDGEIAIAGVPFAQGATGEEILVDLMGAPLRVPGPITDNVDRYAELVGQKKEDTEEARALREKLEANPPGPSALTTVDLEISRRQLLEKLKKGGA